MVEVGGRHGRCPVNNKILREVFLTEEQFREIQRDASLCGVVSWKDCAWVMSV
ncbi:MULTISPECIES: hypothetical protein [Haloferax]|uniref:Uncharacterized protein n=1 Tax=Haloferax massiliensis TaxID=1476858 RepID=A0A0D6JNU3_9EURY|nr:MULTISPECIES: hypothetical protein [Haloferax]MDS0241138.1 hypothetical protein [Haloferax sp. S2CR25]MDS0444259.1 hypothetical protein [Haloferax sp. S2CR25-2]CQR49524.1 hypothetical protein BN996_00985 [Haloferax massiliensis]